MSRKVFISVLGAGNYIPCIYKGANSETKTKYIQEATLNDIKVQSWEATDAVYVLLTEAATTKHWRPEAGGGLEAILGGMGIPCPVRGIDILDGKDEAEMWAIFDKVFSLLEEGDELYFDLTHAFRYIPMLVLVLSNYAKFLKGTKVAYMSYGNYEAGKANGGVAPIMDLLPLVVLQDWAFASGQFVVSGCADGISDLGKRYCTEIKRKLRRPDADTDALGAYLASVRSTSEKLSLCRGVDLIKANDIAYMRKSQDAVKRETIPAFGPLISKITDSFSAFSETKSAANAYYAARWCLKMNLYQQAVTFLREGIVSIICERHGLDNICENDRKLVDIAFRESDAKLNAGKHDEVNPVGGLSVYNVILSDPILQNAEMVSSFKYLRNLRNDLNHSGMRKDPASAKNLKLQIENAVNLFEKVLNLPCESQVLGEVKPSDNIASLFLNYSNHPSSVWSEGQRNAASEFGRIVDIAFRNVDPTAAPELISKFADEESVKIIAESKGKNAIVHIMGEMTFTYALVARLKKAGIRCVASTTERIVVDNGDGSRTSMFNFVRFRDYE